MLVSETIKMAICSFGLFQVMHFSSVLKQQEVEDTPELLYNELGCERLLDVSFSGPHMLYQQLAQRVDPRRYRYFLRPLYLSLALLSLMYFSASNIGSWNGDSISELWNYSLGF